ncbi:MAG: L-histidine N(alpha)-methyltransferase [Alphaproteobacteria bacterium]|nr:L-histidine N(alpha)-methyltransferase [Alphaproteobacteria bacterium]MBV8548115.1 L-histidine N(alpha)-methyltransferase [Alphaproteobacteria bacterium]
MYADHKGERSGQSMSGAKLWATLANDEPDYPIARADVWLLNDSLSDILPYIPPHIPLYDLGPGNKSAIESKSLKLLEKVESSRYVAVDASEAYAEAAAQAVKDAFPQIATALCVGDIYTDKEKVTEPTLAYFGGSTIGNIPNPVSQDFPFDRLVDTLGYLLSYARKGWLLLSFDTTSNNAELHKRYDNKASEDFACNVLYRAACELPIEGFDPNLFKHVSKWVPESHQLAHLLVATAEQHIKINGQKLVIKKGQELHITNSYKITPKIFEAALAEVGCALEYKSFDTTGMALYLVRSPYAAPVLARSTPTTDNVIG